MSTMLLLLTIVISSTIPSVCGMDFGGQQKFCPPYRCGKGQESVPKWPLGLKSTGCSGMGGMMMAMGGQKDTESPLESCCDIRHACIQTCGSLKSACDAEFQTCVETTCSNLDDPDAKKDCDSNASIYKIMVQMDDPNCQNFDAQQYAHCECVSTDKLQSKREQVLTKFYKKVNPESVHKVGNIVSKIDSSKKMAALMIKLYKKYPQVIKKIKDPKQEEWQRMMKEAGTKAEKQEDDEDEEEENDNVEDLGTQEL